LAQSGWFELLEKLVDHRGFRISSSSFFGRVLGGNTGTERTDDCRANQKVLKHEILPPKKLDNKNTKRRLRLTGRLAPFRFHLLLIQRDSPGGLRSSGFIFQ
jgi:hypothetical protein